MNKELIKKYKGEFDHWLSGGAVQVYYKTDDELKWWTDEENIEACNNDNFSHMIKYSLDPNDVLVVIDDEYVEYRKALAEGKTIQYYVDGFVGWQDVKSLNQSCIHPSSFRIKPEEPKFKVGDWAVNKTSKQHIIKKVTSVYSDSVTVGDSTVSINVMLIKDLELWQPKIGEWCWFWNDSFDVPILAKLISIDSVFGRPLEYKVKTPSCISEISYNYMSNTSFKKCEPFIGQLPSILKD